MLHGNAQRTLVLAGVDLSTISKVHRNRSACIFLATQKPGACGLAVAVASRKLLEYYGKDEVDVIGCDPLDLVISKVTPKASSKDIARFFATALQNLHREAEPSLRVESIVNYRSCASNRKGYPERQGFSSTLHIGLLQNSAGKQCKIFKATLLDLRELSASEVRREISKASDCIWFTPQRTAQTNQPVPLSPLASDCPNHLTATVWQWRQALVQLSSHL